MPCLGEMSGYIVGFIIHASWVVIRPHLKGYDGAPMNDIIIHIGICAYLTINWKLKWCRRRNLDSMVLEQRMIECRLFGDVHTVYDISINFSEVSRVATIYENS
jgi:hypothetical protein